MTIDDAVVKEIAAAFAAAPTWTSYDLSAFETQVEAWLRAGKIPADYASRLKAEVKELARLANLDLGAVETYLENTLGDAGRGELARSALAQCSFLLLHWQGSGLLTQYQVQPWLAKLQGVELVQSIAAEAAAAAQPATSVANTKGVAP